MTPRAPVLEALRAAPGRWRVAEVSKAGTLLGCRPTHSAADGLVEAAERSATSRAPAARDGRAALVPA